MQVGYCRLVTVLTYGKTQAQMLAEQE